MIEHIFSAVCSSSSIDSETNAFSLFNILEQVTITARGEIPELVNIPFELFSDWVRKEVDQPATGRIRVSFCDPADSCKQISEMDLDLSHAVFFRTRIRSAGLPITGPGKYKFLIQKQIEEDKGWETVANIPILIQIEQRE